MEQQWSDLGSCCRRWVVPSALRKCNRFWALLTTAATLTVHAGSPVMCEFEAGHPLPPQGVWNPQADVVPYAQAGHLCWTVECRTVLSKKKAAVRTSLGFVGVMGGGGGGPGGGGRAFFMCYSTSLSRHKVTGIRYGRVITESCSKPTAVAQLWCIREGGQSAMFDRKVEDSEQRRSRRKTSHHGYCDQTYHGCAQRVQKVLIHTNKWFNHHLLENNNNNEITRAMFFLLVESVWCLHVKILTQGGRPWPCHNYRAFGSE